MKQIASYLASVAALAGLSVMAVADEEAPRSPLSAEDAAETAPLDIDQAMAEIAAYIESIDTMRGDFLQIAADGSVSDGQFYIRRPGRLRFEYAAPSPNLVIADGTWVVLQDTELKTTDRYPLRSTPLRLLLARNVDLSALTVVSVAREAGLLTATLQSNDEETYGTLSLVFAEPELELRQWTVIDAQGFATTIVLNNVVRGEKLDPRLFVAKDTQRFLQGG